MTRDGDDRSHRRLDGAGDGPTTLVQALVELVQQDGQRPTAVFRGRNEAETLSRAGLGTLTAAHAEGLLSAGVVQGDRVVLAWPTCSDFLGAFWACQFIGAIPVPAPSLPRGRVRGDGERLRSIIRRCRPAAISASDETSRVLCADELRGVPLARPVEGATWCPPDTAPSPDDVALIQYTSGSTSEPRGCVLTHRAVVANVAQAAARLGIDHPQHGVNWCPLFHDMGLIGGVVLPVWSKHLVAVHLAPHDFAVNPALWLRAIDGYRAEISAAPSFALGLVARRLRRGGVELDLSSLRSVFCGAEPLHPASIREFLTRTEPLGLSPEAIHPAYGLAEHVVLVSSRPAGFATDRVSPSALAKGRAQPAGVDEPCIEVPSLGVPVAGCDVRIVGDDGALPGERVVGEIEVSSPSVMVGYLDDLEATAEVRRDAWLRTGDLGYVAGGELFVTGRRKDLIIVGGRNVFPNDVEHAVEAIDGLRLGGVAAFGTVAADGGEDLVVVVECRSSTAAFVAPDVKRACVAAIGVAPRQVIAVAPGALPRTSSGKIQRTLARDRFASKLERQ